MKEKLKLLSYLTWRTTEQTKELFELCDSDFEKLLKVEAIVKRHNNFLYPCDFDTVEQFVSEWKVEYEDERELRKLLSVLSNRGLAQTNFLFELCDNDFDKLFKLEATIKRTFYSGCPADVETVNEVLKSFDELELKNK